MDTDSIPTPVESVYRPRAGTHQNIGCFPHLSSVKVLFEEVRGLSVGQIRIGFGTAGATVVICNRQDNIKWLQCPSCPKTWDTNGLGEKLTEPVSLSPPIIAPLITHFIHDHCPSLATQVLSDDAPTLFFYYICSRCPKISQTFRHKKGCIIRGSMPLITPTTLLIHFYLEVPGEDDWSPLKYITISDYHIKGSQLDPASTILIPHNPNDRQGVIPALALIERADPAMATAARAVGHGQTADPPAPAFRPYMRYKRTTPNPKPKCDKHAATVPKTQLQMIPNNNNNEEERPPPSAHSLLSGLLAAELAVDNHYNVPIPAATVVRRPAPQIITLSDDEDNVLSQHSQAQLTPTPDTMDTTSAEPTDDLDELREAALRSMSQSTRRTTITVVEPSTPPASVSSQSFHDDLAILVQDARRGHRLEQFRIPLTELLPNTDPDDVVRSKHILSLRHGTQEHVDTAQRQLEEEWTNRDDGTTAEDDSLSINLYSAPLPTCRPLKRQKAQGRPPPGRFAGKHAPHVAKQYSQNRAATFKQITGSAVQGDMPSPMVAHSFFPLSVPQVDNSALAEVLKTMPKLSPQMKPDPFTLQELTEAIKSTKRKSPGPDDVDNAMIKEKSYLFPLLLALLNAVRFTALIPSVWRTSKVIFIPKSLPAGTRISSTNPGHHRPIALQQTTLKLMSTLLHRRLSDTINKILHPMQKGFQTLTDGCHIQNFHLKTIHRETLQIREGGYGLPLYAAMLDIKSAFPSIPHSSLLLTLQQTGLHPQYLAYLTALYSSHTARCKTSPECDCPVLCGLLQGDPLSPLLANLYLSPLLFCLSYEDAYVLANDERVPALAFADDLLILSPSKQGLQRQLDRLTATANALHITFNTSKSHIFCTQYGHPIHCSSFFSLQGKGFPHDPDPGVHKYLGTPYDDQLNCLCPSTVLHTAHHECSRITNSNLRPYQKLDALRCFVQSKLIFGLRECPIPANLLTSLQKAISTCARTALNCVTFPNDALHLPVHLGGCGVWNVTLLYHCLSITSCVDLLNSSCGFTRRLARFEVVCNHAHLPPDMAKIPRKSSSNPWTRLRHSLGSLMRCHNTHCEVIFPEVIGPAMDQITPIRVSVNKQLLPHPLKLHDILELIHQTHAAAVSHTSERMRFAQILVSPLLLSLRNKPRLLTDHGWYFMWQAQHFQIHTDHPYSPSCICGKPQSTSHYQSVGCTRLEHRGAVVNRHNRIGRVVLRHLSRLPGITVKWEHTLHDEACDSDGEDSQLPPDILGKPRLKPDLTISSSDRDNGKIIDVVVSCSPVRAYEHKVLKYQQHARDLSRITGRTFTNGSLAITPWGSYDPRSVTDFRSLGIPDTTIKSMFLECIREAIDCSAYISTPDNHHPSRTRVPRGYAAQLF